MSQKELIQNLNEILEQKDTVLIPENIKAGVTILGVEGSSEVVDTSDATAEGLDILKGKVAYTKGYRVTGMYEPLNTSDATATEAHIVNGKTAYVNGKKITGNIPTNGYLYYTPSAKNQEIPVGYTEGGLVYGDTNLKPENIKKDVQIFNVTGDYVAGVDTNDATAVASQILQGQTAYVKEVKITGTMPNQGSKIITPGHTIQSFPYGYYSNLQVRGDDNLIPSNIKAGTTIFGVEGDLDVALDTADGTAVASDIKKDKVAYVKGERITGTHECLNTADANAYASEILAGKTAYVNGQKITGTMPNKGIYEAVVNKDTDNTNYIYSYVQAVRTPSVINSIKSYTTPNVYDSHCQGCIQGLTTLTGTVNSLKGCRVIAFIMTRSALTIEDGWELIAENLLDSQFMYVYTKIATETITELTISQAQAGRMGLNLLSFDLENEIEVISENTVLTETSSSYSISNLQKGDLLSHHYFIASDGGGGMYQSSLSGPSSTVYRTTDATDRLCTFRINYDYSSSANANLGGANTAYGYVLIRFKNVQPLVPENIRKGIKIMDFVGTFEGEFDHSEATATANDLVLGKTAFNSKGELIRGTITDNGVLNYTPLEVEQTIPVGYTQGGKIEAIQIENLTDYNKCYQLTNDILGFSCEDFIQTNLKTFLQAHTYGGGGVLYDTMETHNATITETVTLNNQILNISNGGFMQLSGVSMTKGTWEIYARIPSTYQPMQTDAWYSQGAYFGNEYGGTVQDFGVVIDKNGYIGIGYSTASIQSSSVKANDDQWHHIVLTYESGVYKLYVDNNLAATVNYSMFSTIPDYFGIFSNVANSSSIIPGDFSYFRYYDRVLTASEINVNYNYAKALDVSGGE